MCGKACVYTFADETFVFTNKGKISLKLSNNVRLQLKGAQLIQGTLKLIEIVTKYYMNELNLITLVV